MKIAIIGTGNIGATLARHFRRLGPRGVRAPIHRGPGSLTGLAAETGAIPVTVEAAARNGEVVTAVSGKFAPCEVKIQKIGKPAR